MPRIKDRAGCNKPTGILAIVLFAMAATTMANAQTSFQSYLIARPLTPGEITNFKLPSTTETSSGNTTIGVGQPAYLEAQTDTSIAASAITGVTWQLTTKPPSSKAVIGNTPLPATLPIYEPADRSVLQVAGRALLRPDVTGEYVVTAIIATSAGSATVAQTFIASNYVGINACTVCHSGGLAANMVSSWKTTA